MDCNDCLRDISENDDLSLLQMSLRPIGSYIANEPVRGERTGKSGRNGRVCNGTWIIDNVGIDNLRIAAFRRLVECGYLVACVASCVLLVARPAMAADTPYYGTFGPGFVHLNADGTYGKGEIRSGDLGLKFYGPRFDGPYNFKLFVRDNQRDWTGDLVANAASGVKIKYLPLFPKCSYEFEHRDVPLQVKMEAFAPWIPGDSKMSSLPVLFFDFEIANPTETEKTAAVAFAIPNPECDGGQAVRENDGTILGAMLHSKRAGGGTLSGVVRNDGDATVTWGGNFAKGKLDGAKGNAVASSITVPAKSTRHIVFIFAWDFPVYISGDGKAWPRKELGHYHNNFYQRADAIARDCRDSYPSILAGVNAWFHGMWKETNLPEWMRRQILISTSHMAYNGVFFKNGTAAVKEGDNFDLVGTYDEQFHCSLCEVIFLPAAEWGNLRIFADIQLPNGAIRHDLGAMCVTATQTSPDHGTPWPGSTTVKGDNYWDAGDNTPEWILDLYRDYLWTGDLAKLKALWPNVQKGCEYMLAGDKNGSGLFDDGKHYDCFARVPENMYINDLQRAAFQAAAKIAGVMDDQRSRDAYDARSERIAKAMEEFWNPKGFYSVGRSQPNNLISSGLYGEHSDDLLHLSRQLDETRVHQHLQYMGTLGHNFQGKTFRVMEHVSGGPQPTNAPLVPETAMSNAEGLRDYCALALWRGCTEEAIAVAKCYYDLIYEELKRPWDQPMLFDEQRKPIFGNHYQSVPAAWHLLLGLEGLSWDVPDHKLWIRPNLPESFHGKLRAFLPGAIAWGNLDYSSVEKDCDQRFVLTFAKPFELATLGVRNSGKPTVSAIQDGKAAPCSLKVVNKNEYEVAFTPKLHLNNRPVEIRIGVAP